MWYAESQKLAATQASLQKMQARFSMYPPSYLYHIILSYAVRLDWPYGQSNAEAGKRGRMPRFGVVRVVLQVVFQIVMPVTSQ